MIASRAKTVLRRALPALAATGVLSFAFTSIAHAQEWGEFEHAFISSGKGAGQVNGAGHTAFAVDSATGSFYVADELEEGAQPKFRIQRFEFDGKGGVTAKGSIEFAVPATGEKGEKESSPGQEVQLAVDSANGRVYALVVSRRREENEKEEKELEKEEAELEAKGEKCEPNAKPPTCYERQPLDYEEMAAGELYAFYYKSGALVPAKTKEGKLAPIVTEKGFLPQGETPKQALLNPHGLAVEPETGDLFITGQQDVAESNEKIEKGEESAQVPRGDSGDRRHRIQNHRRTERQTGPSLRG